MSLCCIEVSEGVSTASVLLIINDTNSMICSTINKKGNCKHDKSMESDVVGGEGVNQRKRPHILKFGLFLETFVHLYAGHHLCDLLPSEKAHVILIPFI